MRYNGFLFGWDKSGNVTVTLCVDKQPLTKFVIDDKDCDDVIKNLTYARKQAKRAKRG